MDVDGAELGAGKTERREGGQIIGRCQEAKFIENKYWTSLS